MGDAIMLDPPTSGPPITDAAAVNARARELIRQNVRYRLADKLNNAMKSLGLQHVLKRFFAGRV
jgi:hypothetical protein